MAAPRWFSDALASTPTHHDIDVGGIRIHYRAWGKSGGERPGLVLLHGGAAHSGWWDHIAPQLATNRRVIATDLSGHGDSAWKPEYDRSQWAREVVAAVDAEGLRPAVFVGHSMGGWVSVFAAVLEPAAVREVIAIDSPLTEAPPEEEPIAQRPPNKVYAAREEAIARFRTVPPQAGNLAFVEHHVAMESLREVDGGWTWKFDPGIFGQRGWVRDLLPRLAVPLTIVRCQHGMVDDAMAKRIAGLPRDGARVVKLPDAGHHAMFDQPLALIETLHGLLA